MIVQRLREIQNRDGFLADTALVELGKELNVPLSRLQEIAGFFPHFRQEWNKPKPIELHVCRDMTCHRNGADTWLYDNDKGLCRWQSENPELVAVHGASCLGRCDRAPAALVSVVDEHGHHHEHLFAGKTLPQMHAVVEQLIAGKPLPSPSTDAERKVDRSNWTIDPYALDPKLAPYAVTKAYLAAHRMPIPAPPRGLDGKETRTYVAQQHPFLERIRLSTLAGMGGGGAPAFQKWFDVWIAPGDVKYIVCNGDESEPSTFKDREILLQAPHTVVEGVLLAGLILGATRGAIFIRHEYHEQIEAVRNEIARAVELNALGENIFGSGRDFPIEVFESPGGYICGEQSALIEAMSDRRSQPRNRPPELATNGLDDKPTLVNNVETLAWVPSVLHHGGEKYATGGLPAFKGRRFFSLCGDLKAPGVFEVPIGLTLGELIDMAGGMNGKLYAVAPSGPSAGFLPAMLPVKPGAKERLDKLVARVRTPAEGEVLKAFFEKHNLETATSLTVRALPLDIAFFRNVGSLLGVPIELMLGGGLAVYSEGIDILAAARNATMFYRNESCGKCVPCRIGSQKFVEVGTALLRKHSTGKLPEDRDMLLPPPSRPIPPLTELLELAKTMALTSICGLGQVAPNPLTTTLLYFPIDGIAESGIRSVRSAVRVPPTGVK